MKRNEVENKYKWDLSAMVESDEKFEELFAKVEAALPVLEGYKGKLGNRDDALAAFELDAETSRIFELLYIYSHMFRDEDANNDRAVGLASRTDGLSGNRRCPNAL